MAGRWSRGAWCGATGAAEGPCDALAPALTADSWSGASPFIMMGGPHIREPAPMQQQHFDRAAEDLGNSVHLEHVNVQVPDQRLATLFYVTGLGLTRDPYLMVSDSNMWVNVGRSQFHLPTGAPQVLRGHTALIIPGRKALLDRLASVVKKLEGTKFSFREHNDYVEATCPWGNRVRVHEPDADRFGRIALSIPYVEFDVPPGTAKAIAAFYPEIMDIPAELRNGDGNVAWAKVGNDQYLQFR